MFGVMYEMKRFLMVVMALIFGLFLFGCNKGVDDVAKEDVSQAVIYVGTSDSGFKEYSVDVEGEITGEKLVDEIESLTGWNITLSHEITSGKGSMTVCFDGSSCIFTGPPEEQKDEFHVYDQYELAQVVLDSVKKTLQENFVSDDGDSDSFDVYYCMNDNEPLVIESIGRSWSLEEPYSW